MKRVFALTQQRLNRARTGKTRRAVEYRDLGLKPSIGAAEARIMEMASVACGDREVAAFVRGVVLSDDIAPAPRSGLRVRF